MSNVLIHEDSDDFECAPSGYRTSVRSERTIWTIRIKNLDDEDEYPLPVINTATTDELLSISSDCDTGGTVEAAGGHARGWQLGLRGLA